MIHSSPIKDTGHMFLFSLLGPAEKKITSCFLKFPPQKKKKKHPKVQDSKIPRSHFLEKTCQWYVKDRKWLLPTTLRESSKMFKAKYVMATTRDPRFLPCFSIHINHQHHQPSTISSLSLTVAKTHPQELQQMRLHGELATAIRIHVVRLCVAFGVSPLEDLLKFGWGYDA